jgi:hypothetical protein
LVFRAALETNGQRDYRTALIDAAINGGFTFFSTMLASVAGLGLVPMSCMIAGLSTGVSFFASLILSLNIRKVETVEKEV